MVTAATEVTYIELFEMTMLIHIDNYNIIVLHEHKNQYIFFESCSEDQATKHHCFWCDLSLNLITSNLLPIKCLQSLKMICKILL